MAASDPSTDEKPVESNAERRRTRLLREIKKQHNWRIQTWAKAELYIRARQEELVSLGFEQEELFEPDLKDSAMVDFYANNQYTE